MALQEVKYNGFEIPFAQVSYSSRASYDETDRTIQLHIMRFRITGLLHANTQADLEDKLVLFQGKMAQARKWFLWQINGTTLWSIAAPGVPGGNVNDRRNGPKPRLADVQKVAGGLSARILVEIECAISTCDTALHVEELWWKYSYSIDRNFSVTRTVVGRVRVPSPVDGPISIFFNQDFWPKLPRGFYRESIRHSTSADGLQVDFTITDRQVWRTLPQPLTSGHASFRVDQKMAVLTKTLSASFEAPVNVDKRVIMNFITALIEARFPNAFKGVNPNAPNSGLGSIREYFTQFSVTNHEFENRMDVTITSLQSAKNLVPGDLNGERNLIVDAGLMGDVSNVPFTATVDSSLQSPSDGDAYIEGPLGTAGLVPSKSPAFDVCQGIVGTSEEIQRSERSFERLAEDNASAVSTRAEAENILSDEHATYPYISYVEQWSYILDFNVRILQPTVAETEGTSVQDIVQRVANPQLRIVQIGTARRIGKPPDIPKLPIVVTGPDVTPLQVLQQEVRHGAPQVLSDGRTAEYQASWTFNIISPYHRFLDDEEFAPAEVGTTDTRVPVSPLIQEDDRVISPDIVFLGADQMNRDGSYTTASDSEATGI